MDINNIDGMHLNV